MKKSAYLVKMKEIESKVEALLADYTADEILTALVDVCPGREREALNRQMEQEVSYTSKFKMIRIDNLAQEMALEEFLDKLYPYANDRQLSIL